MHFAERYYQQHLTYITQAIEEARRRHDEASEQVQRLAFRLFTSVWQRTEQLRFAESAVAMVADLSQRTSLLALRRTTAAYPLPATPLWLTLAQPIIPYFDKYTDFDHPEVAALHWWPMFDTHLQAAVTDLTVKEYIWLLDLISPGQETVVSLAFDRNIRTWDTSPVHRCPYELCADEDVYPLCARWQWYWQVRFPLLSDADITAWNAFHDW